MLRKCEKCGHPTIPTELKKGKCWYCRFGIRVKSGRGEENGQRTKGKRGKASRHPASKG